MRLVLAAAATALAALAGAGEAWGCSCVPWGNPRAELARADGAFVGVYLGRRPLGAPRATPSSADPLLYRFRVERRLKGRIGSTVEVVSARHGASCGLEVVRGRRVALLLRRVGGRWHSGLCDQRPAGFFRGVPARVAQGC